jgi:hypothetical protein
MEGHGNSWKVPWYSQVHNYIKDPTPGLRGKCVCFPQYHPPLGCTLPQQSPTSLVYLFPFPFPSQVVLKCSHLFLPDLCALLSDTQVSIPIQIVQPPTCETRQTSVVRLSPLGWRASLNTLSSAAQVVNSVIPFTLFSYRPDRPGPDRPDFSRPDRPGPDRPDRQCPDQTDQDQNKTRPD